MKKIKMKNLPELHTEDITALNESEMRSVKGGFLSIGHACSHRTKCDRLWTKCWGDTNGSEPGGECTHEDILNSA